MPFVEDGESLWHGKVVVQSVVQCLPPSAGEPAGKVTFGLNLTGLANFECAKSVSRSVETITASVARLANSVALHRVGVVLLDHKTPKLVVIRVGRVVVQPADEVLVRALLPLGDTFQFLNCLGRQRLFIQIQVG